MGESGLFVHLEGRFIEEETEFRATPGAALNSPQIETACTPHLIDDSIVFRVGRTERLFSSDGADAGESKPAGFHYTDDVGCMVLPEDVRKYWASRSAYCAVMSNLSLAFEKFDDCCSLLVEHYSFPQQIEL